MFWVYVWFAITILALVIEFCTNDMMAIWFVFSGVVSMLLAVLEIDWYIQIAVFVVSAGLLMFVFNKMIVKYLRKRRARTNAESIVGSEHVLLTDLSLGQPGTISIYGSTWTVVAENPEEKIMAGKKVVIKGLKGSKYIVTEVKKRLSKAEKRAAERAQKVAKRAEIRKQRKEKRAEKRAARKVICAQKRAENKVKRAENRAERKKIRKENKEIRRVERLARANQKLQAAQAGGSVETVEKKPNVFVKVKNSFKEKSAARKAEKETKLTKKELAAKKAAEKAVEAKDIAKMAAVKEAEALKAAKEAMILALAAKEVAYEAAKEAALKESQASKSAEDAIFGAIKDAAEKNEEARVAQMKVSATQAAVDEERAKAAAKEAAAKAATMAMEAKVEAARAAAEEAQLKAALAKLKAEETALKAAAYKKPDKELAVETDMTDEIGSEEPKEKKGGFAGLWNKIKSPFKGKKEGK